MIKTIFEAKKVSSLIGSKEMIWKASFEYFGQENLNSEKMFSYGQKFVLGKKNFAEN